MEERDTVSEIASEMGIRQKILLRITPGIDPHTHQKISTGGVDSKFGSAIETGLAEKIAVFHAGNFSLGIAILCDFARRAAAMMPEANIEIIEKHHNQKLDAPSGTALMLANDIKEARTDATFVCGRYGHGKRTEQEIGIHALRLGGVIGEHEVILATPTETITLKHEAHTRALFADGALVAASFLLGKPAGLYNMKDIVKN